jgi:hypothetical protein
MDTLQALEPVSNDAAAIIDISQPYAVACRVVGTCPILFHRWSVESVEAKGRAAKGSAAKKTDDVDSYVYRMPSGELAIPSENLRMSVINAAKYRQDPRSPRKSAMDLFKAAIACFEPYCGLGVSKWEYIDQRRVTVQRAGVTRRRPALAEGWSVEVIFQILLPEYISPTMLNETIQSAGKLIGVCDFRPSYGRYQVTEFRVV